MKPLITLLSLACCIIACNINDGNNLEEAIADTEITMDGTDPETAINKLVDNWHQAASDADSMTYFSSMHNDASIFMGTDATERWTTVEFAQWSHRFFQRESAWTFVPRTRHVKVHGVVGWFDEVLDSDHMGECRGSGVVIQGDEGQWRIAHYVLSFPVPNDLADALVENIQTYQDSLNLH